MTARGAAAGQTTSGLLARVLSMAGVGSDVQVRLVAPPPRDPFRVEPRGSHAAV